MRGTIRYRKEMQKTYMIIEAEKEIIESYEGQMALRGSLQRLAKCDVQTIDGKKEVRYDISSLQTVEQMFAVKEIDFQSLKDLLCQITETIREAENSLIDARQLCFEPEYLYWDREKERLRVLFDYTELQEESSVRKLAEFLLERICHEEEKSVDLAYFFFGCVEKENICIVEVEEYMEKQEGEKREEEKNGEEEQSQYRLEKREDRTQREIEMEIEERILWQKPQQQEAQRQKLLHKRILWSGKDGSIIETGLAAVLTALLTGIAFWGVETYFVLTEIEKRIWIGISVMLFLSGICIFLYGLAAEKRKEQRDERKENEKNREAAAQDVVSGEAMPAFFEEKSQPKEADGKTIYIGNSLSHREYKLVQEKKGTEREYPVNMYPFLIGKDKERVSLPIKEHSVSRIHARLIREEEDVYIEDLHSTNGTYLNDLLLTPHEPVKVRRGDFIQFGKAEFVLR
ncbi:MAG: FHA domain-containing protein [Lachnospiraceae bacterium]|nr:FHA domain-containing protein [Lachnospiraceae bacterium]